MIRVPLFPTPYRGELFYSILARFGKWLAYSGLKTRTELLSYCNKVALVLPGNLEQICNKLPAGSIINPGYIIENHSILRIFSPFVPEARMNLIENAMKIKKYVLVNTLVAGEKTYISEYLKFCPQCVKQDENTFGEAYWHIIHQLRGVWYCHIHGAPLLNSTINVIHRAVNRIEALSQGTERSHLQLPILDISQPMYDIVDNYNWLLNNHVSYLGKSIINTRYRVLLKQAGLMSRYDYINTKNCLMRFQEIFPESFLEECDFLKDPRYWIYSTIYPCKSVCQPLRHIALLVVLGSSVEQFVHGSIGFNYISEPRQFKCKRPYGERYIEKRDDYRRRLICIMRLFPEATREQLIRVFQYCYRWLRANDAEWFNKNMPPSQRSVPNIKRVKSISDRSSIKAYKKDELMVQMINEAVEKLMLMESPPVWINMASLKRTTGLTILSETDEMEKYPLTRDMLARVIESIESFRLRKMRFNLSKLPPGTKISKNMLLRMGGMNTDNITPLIKEEIERQLILHVSTPI